MAHNASGLAYLVIPLEEVYAYDIDSVSVIIRYNKPYTLLKEKPDTISGYSFRRVYASNIDSVSGIILYNNSYTLLYDAMSMLVLI